MIIQNKICLSLLMMFVFSTLSLQAQEFPNTEAEFKSTYKKNIKKSRINGVYIPKDMDDAFGELDNLSTKESKMKFKSGTEDVVADKLQRAIGQWMIVNWNFYEGSRMSHYLKNMGVSIPDDMSQFIIVSYYRHLKGAPLELEQRAQSIFEKRKEEQKERNKNKTVISKP